MDRMHRSRRTFAAAFAAAPLAALVPAARAAAPKCAVMSLAADRITVVTRAETVGSSLSRNAEREIVVPGGTLDRAALLALDDGLRRLQQPEAVMLLSRDAGLYAAQERLFAADGDAADAVAVLRGLLAQSGVQQLILLTRWRTDARFPLKNGNVGDGKIAGLGFYLDNLTSVQNIDSGRIADGYVAAYAALRLTLIDAATLRPLRAVDEFATHVESVAGTEKAMRAWDVLTTAQKFERLDAVLRKAIAAALPRLLAA